MVNKLNNALNNEVKELLQMMIQSPSINPPGQVDDCANIIKGWLIEQGIEAELLYGGQVANVVAVLEGSKGKGPTLLWNGHLDVVPPGEDWTVDPFGGEYKDGYIYGRGSCDMKSGLVSMMIALKNLKENGLNFKGKIIFTAVGDEETGSENGTLLLLDKGVAVSAAYAINSEPTSLRIELGQRGLRWFDLMVKGVAAHAGRPHLGKNSIEQMSLIITAIRNMKFDLIDDRFEVKTPTISATTIKGGSKVNVIPDRCVLGIDRRMLPGETQSTIVKEIEDVIQSVTEEGFSVELKMHGGKWDPYCISENEPVAKALSKAYEIVTQTKPKLAYKGACTDASYFYHIGGIPTVIFGPGNEQLSHKPDERVALDHVIKAAQVYYTTALELLS